MNGIATIRYFRESLSCENPTAGDYLTAMSEFIHKDLGPHECLKKSYLDRTVSDMQKSCPRLYDVLKKESFIEKVNNDDFETAQKILKLAVNRFTAPEDLPQPNKGKVYVFSPHQQADTIKNTLKDYITENHPLSLNEKYQAITSICCIAENFQLSCVIAKPLIIECILMLSEGEEKIKNLLNFVKTIDEEEFSTSVKGIICTKGISSATTENLEADFFAYSLIENLANHIIREETINQIAIEELIESERNKELFIRRLQRLSEENEKKIEEMEVENAQLRESIVNLNVVLEHKKREDPQWATYFNAWCKKRDQLDVLLEKIKEKEDTLEKLRDTVDKLRVEVHGKDGLCERYKKLKEAKHGESLDDNLSKAKQKMDDLIPEIQKQMSKVSDKAEAITHPGKFESGRRKFAKGLGNRRGMFIGATVGGIVGGTVAGTLSAAAIISSGGQLAPVSVFIVPGGVFVGSVVGGALGGEAIQMTYRAVKSIHKHRTNESDSPLLTESSLDQSASVQQSEAISA